MKKSGLNSFFLFIFLIGITVLLLQVPSKTEHVSTSNEKNPIEKQKLTVEEVEKLSAQSLQILQNLISSGGALNDQTQLNHFLSSLNDYEYETIRKVTLWNN